MKKYMKKLTCTAICEPYISEKRTLQIRQILHSHKMAAILNNSLEFALATINKIQDSKILLSLHTITFNDFTETSPVSEASYELNKKHVMTSYFSQLQLISSIFKDGSECR